MRRKLLILSALVICIATLAGGTLAYFTAEGKAQNVITTGNVKIALQEWADTEKTKPFENVDNVVPGRQITKIVEVKNTGASDAWVRVQVDEKIILENGDKGIPDLASLDYNTTDWIYNDSDGYYYYNKVLQPNEVTEPIFTSVTFNGEMDNTYQNATVTVDVTAYAVQSANNGSTVEDAKGWPNA